MTEEPTITIRQECHHGMGDTAWCALCQTHPTPSPIPAPTSDTVEAFSIGITTAQRIAGSQPVNQTPRGADDTRAGTATVWEITVGTTDRLDVHITTWPGYPMELTGRFRYGPERLIGIHKRHMLRLNQHQRGWWSSLTNQSVFNPTEPDRPSKRTPTMRQLTEGAAIDDAALDLQRLGGHVLHRRALGTVKRRGDGLVLLGTHGNEAVHIASYLISRLLPVYHRYEG